jgi:peptidoglycan/LPS O-acetylase OafA/YrhL
MTEPSPAVLRKVQANHAAARAVSAENRTVDGVAAPPISTRRIPELDGLRGLAIMPVLIWHFGSNSGSAGGVRWIFYLKDAGSLFWSGVDLFFVFSGS